MNPIIKIDVAKEDGRYAVVIQLPEQTHTSEFTFGEDSSKSSKAMMKALEHIENILCDYRLTIDTETTTYIDIDINDIPDGNVC